MSVNVKEYQKEYQKKYRFANADKLAVYQQSWYAKNKDKARKFQKEYNLSHKKERRQYKWKLLYGITPEEVDAKYTDQCGCCAICKMELNNVFDIDHCHTNGKVRGLLCKHCNKGLGIFNENVSILTNAIDYINKWNL